MHRVTVSFVTALFAFGCGAPNTPTPPLVELRDPTPPLVELGDRLSGRHIRALLSGATLYGRYVFYDATYVEYYDTDGSYLIERSRILGNSNKKNFEGQWKVRGNLLCIDHILYLDAGGCHELYYKDGSIQIVDPSTGSFVAFTTRIERGEELATVASPITPTPPPTPKPVQIPSQKPAEPELISSGTGFVVSSQTYILTNEHVVRGCQKIRVRSDSVELIPNLAFRDRENDLALLKLPPKSQVVASFRAGGGIRPGDWILGVGFPLRGLLASEANITVGVVSALAGIGNDHRFLQISTPVQSGNSGGPLLDQSGNVIGVIFAKLDAVTVAKLTGDIPQNVNFAIKGRLVEAFLEANGVDYKTRASTSTLKPADIAQRGRVFTVPVECWK